MKKVFSFFLPFFTIISFGIVSCGGGEEINNDLKNDSIGAEQTSLEEKAELDLSTGETIYQSKCMVCHQAQGEGVEGTFPPLANSDYLLADKMRAVKQAIYGSNVPIVVNGIKYSGDKMTKDLGLTNEQVRDVVNYILNSWGNNGGVVTLEDVKKAKGQ